MNDKDKLYKKLNRINNKIQKIIQKTMHPKDVRKIIDLLYQTNSLLRFISTNIQSEFLKKLKHFQHYFYSDVSSYHVNMIACINILKMVIYQLKDEKTFFNLIPTQKYYKQGQKLTIIEDLYEILKTAKKSILYRDEYMDYLLIGILKNIRANNIKLLLKNPDDKFKVWIESFEQQEGKKIQYKKIKKNIIHDRYFLIDNKEIWQTGGTINSRKINAMTVTKITNKTTFNDIKIDLEKNWVES